MSEPESLNTMMHNSYEKVADGEYALRTAIADGQVITTDPSNESRATSVFANGKQAAPVANTAIATTADLAAGTWDIEARIAVLGTTVADVETDNIRFNIGATPVATPTINVPGTTGSTEVTYFKCRIDTAAPTPVSINSGPAAASAGSIYVADIVATRYAGV